MQIIAEIFYLQVYISVIGALFTVATLFASRVLRLTVPLWFALCGLAVYVLPFLAPDVQPVSPEGQLWADGFYLAAGVWGAGCLIFLLLGCVRLALAGRALQRSPLCGNERLAEVCRRTAMELGLRRMPVLREGRTKQPVCIAGIFHPPVLVNASIMEQLDDRELTVVFCHELTHIQRRHVLLERIFDAACALNWFNPFVWIARWESSLYCEMDCHVRAIKNLPGGITRMDYARAVIRLLELAAVGGFRSGQEMGALSFLLTKRRILRITAGPSLLRERLAAAVLTALILLTIGFSWWFSRQHFYPYPAYGTGAEYGLECGLEYGLEEGRP